MVAATTHRDIRHSLRFRIVTSFALAGLLMGLVYGGMVYGYLHTMEDEVVENVLRLESEDFVRRWQADQSLIPPKNRLLRGFVVDRNQSDSFAAWPSRFQGWAQLREPGIYEFVPDYHLLVAELDADHLLYLFHNDYGVEPLDQSTLAEILVIALVLVMVLTTWFGFIIAKRLIAPVTQLARQVAHSHPDQLPLKLEGSFYRDEVGELANALEHSMQRIHDFIAREQRFTRDASHELRTPVTVIKGACELIDKMLENGLPPKGPLRRIRRAVRDMENIIETFLYLGREGSAVLPEGTAQVDAIVAHSVEVNQYLVEEKDVEVRLEIKERFCVAVPEPVVAITVGNLVRNAFQYTDRGEVLVRVVDQRVLVQDSGVGLSRRQQTLVKERAVRGRDSQGFGLGLSIVYDFCLRHGWQLEIKSSEGKGTKVWLNFAQIEGGTETDATNPAGDA